MCVNKYAYVKRVALTRHTDMTFDHPVYLVHVQSCSNPVAKLGCLFGM